MLGRCTECGGWADESDHYRLSGGEHERVRVAHRPKLQTIRQRADGTELPRVRRCTCGARLEPDARGEWRCPDRWSDVEHAEAVAS